MGARWKGTCCTPFSAKALQSLRQRLGVLVACAALACGGSAGSAAAAEKGGMAAVEGGGGPGAAPTSSGRAQPLNDPVLEARALALGRQLRCVVCQNQSIAESNAELAHDLMNEVRTMLRAGKSEAEIVDFLVARYGEFVLFKPPVDARTLLLWGGPFLLAALALWGLWRTVRERNRTALPPPLDDATRAEVDALLSGTSERKDHV